ncbi:cytochrome P450 [Cytobacillus sp. FJAT-54145]|uniref:Cytochrome P450 n=1 Tax=Cytobacillus spartinae TaxID=3299023 RepID=A0ABW6KCM9_9BACI
MSRVSNVQTSRIQNYIDFRKDTLSFFEKMLYQGEIISLKTGFKPSYIVNSPDFVKEILVAKDRFFVKGRTSKVLRRTIGDGLLTSEKEEHEIQKKHLQPLFYKESIHSYVQTIKEETQLLEAKLQENHTYSIQNEMMQLTLSIISKTMFATDLEESKQELAIAVSEIIEQSAKDLFSIVILPLSVPTQGNKLHKSAIKKLEEMIYRVIVDAKNKPNLYQNTLVNIFLGKGYEKTFSDEEIRDQMLTMLLAGHETTANLLTWIFYELDRNPEVEAQFHNEIDQVDFSKDPFDTYRALPYTQNIIQEGLRLYPPAWLIYREAPQKVELLGETFRPGSSFMISPYAIHRNEYVFKDAKSFKPERFFGNPTWPAFAYFPFGGGSRSCIGSKFALMEAAFILAVLGKRYKFRSVSQEKAIPEPLVSLRLRGGLPMRAIRR